MRPGDGDGDFYKRNYFTAANEIKSIKPTGVTSATNAIATAPATKNKTATMMRDVTMTTNTTMYPAMTHASTFPVTYPGTGFSSLSPHAHTRKIWRKGQMQRRRQKKRGRGHHNLHRSCCRIYHTIRRQTPCCSD